MKNGKFLTLGIESSCDESAVAVVGDGREILSNVISTQIPIHTKFGGVVPEIASRQHLQNINPCVSRALEEAGCGWDDIDLIAVTYGPGLIGAVLIGVATAKALSFATGIPLAGVNHMHGHISACYLQYPELEPSFMSLVISGGHTNIVDVTGYNECAVLGRTRDDAAGEAFDKVARVIGLGYPGGPKMDRAAKEGNPEAIPFKRVMLEKGSYDFSFSGIKTQVLNYVNQEKMHGREINVPDLAASFQKALTDVIVTKVMAAVRERGEKAVAMAGGVAANSALRAAMQAACDREGIRLFAPEPKLCTDNGAMIACAGYYQYKKEGASPLDLDAYADLPF